MKRNEQGNMLIWIVLSVFVILMIITGVILAYKNNLTQQPTPTNETGIPKAKTTDTAPQLPMNQKTEIVTMQEDSSYQTFLVPSQTVNDFVKTLPAGVKVISKKSLQ